MIFANIAQHFSQQTTSVTQYVFAFPENVTAGNQLVLLLGAETSSSAASVTDTQGNVWTAQQFYPGGGDSHGWTLLTATAGQSGSLTCTATFQNQTDAGVVGAELQGVGLDQILSNFGDGDAWTSLPLTTQQPGELLLAFDVSYNSDAAPTDDFQVIEDMVLHADGMALAAKPAPTAGTYQSSWSAGASREWKTFLLSYAPLISGHATIPLPFTQRTTASVATFACIAIASPRAARRLTTNAATIGALALDYAQLNSVYMVLRRQDVANQRAKLVAAVSQALTIVQSLAATLATITALGDDAVRLAQMRAVVDGAVTQIGNVKFDES